MTLETHSVGDEEILVIKLITLEKGLNIFSFLPLLVVLTLIRVRKDLCFRRDSFKSNTFAKNQLKGFMFIPLK